MTPWKCGACFIRSEIGKRRYKQKTLKTPDKARSKTARAFCLQKTIWKGECSMDTRKLRYAKRKAKEKILSQRDRTYYRNLNFRENPNEQAEASPEHYAAQNASLYGRKYASTVKAQGRKLFIRQKEREWQRKKLREQGGRAETLSSSESTLHQPAEKNKLIFPLSCAKKAMPIGNMPYLSSVAANRKT